MTEADLYRELKEATPEELLEAAFSFSYSRLPALARFPRSARLPLHAQLLEVEVGEQPRVAVYRAHSAELRQLPYPLA